MCASPLFVYLGRLLRPVFRLVGATATGRIRFRSRETRRRVRRFFLDLDGVVNVGDQACPARPGAFGHERRFLGLVSIEDALGAVELTGHVIGVVVDLPGRAPQRVVGTYARSTRRSMPVASTTSQTGT
jgi:hypothetical protein